MDTAEASRLPGVIRVYDHDSMKGRYKKLGFFGAGAGFASTDFMPMTGP
jgi:hypothetical protein